MKLSHEEHEHVCIVKLKGDLTSESAAALREFAQHRLDEKTRDFVLDLQDLEWIDSAGLETFVWLQDACAEQLGQVRLAACQDTLAKILECTRLATRFDAHESVDAARQSLV